MGRSNNNFLSNLKKIDLKILTVKILRKKAALFSFKITDGRACN